MAHTAALAGSHSGKRTRDLTEGNITKQLILFALPLILGNLFQLLYNTVDTYVVGNFVSNAAFAAVGNTGPIINTLIGFFGGFATGAGVIIGQYFGAKDEDMVRRTVHTTVLITLLIGAVFTLVGIWMVPGMLRLMNTPSDVFAEATTYLTIYFGGIMTLMVYNVGSGILRAMGDSKRPFYFLVVSALLNVVLDLVFVLVFRMGVAGVAWATVISQGVSATLVILTLCCSSGWQRLSLRYMRIDGAILKKILRVGMPMAVQMAITSFSNVFVQSYINRFGTDFMSGWTAYNKIDQFVMLPMMNISMASTTFVSQNLGAGKKDRARRGAHTAFAMSSVCSLLLMAPVMVFAPSLVVFFNNQSAEVVRYGTELLRLMTPFYLLCGINQIYAGALRGAGKSTVPMIITLSSFVAFRQVYLAIAAPFENYLLTAFSYPAGWLMCSLLILIYYRRSGWLHTDLIRPDNQKTKETV